MDDKSEPAADLLLRYRGVAADWGAFREFIRRVAREVARRPFTVVIVSDSGIRRLNLAFRNKDAATDVLSFPSQPPRRRSTKLQMEDGGLGDVVISAPTAARSAQEHGWLFDLELRALALHGVLHLMGYDHETDRGEMARAERSWGRRLRLPQTLISRQYAKRKRSA